MAIPRVFISSTYYDLKQVRDDIGDFIHGLGYDVIRNEKSRIPYVQNGRLEDDCYREVSSCDILVCIIGSAFGSKSDYDELSITMKELEQAIKERKKVYVFVDRDVLTESQIYRENQDNDYKPVKARDVKVLKYLVDLQDRVGRQHPIVPFEYASGIVEQLRGQLAGLFQNLLQKEQTISAQRNANDLHAEIGELKELVGQMKDDHSSFYNRFTSTVLVKNPVVSLIENKIGFVKCKLLLPDREALIELMSALGYELSESNESLEFSRGRDGFCETLKVLKAAIDDDGKFRVGQGKAERESWVSFEKMVDETEDSVPF